MNKFHKTSYPRQHNSNNFMSSAQGKRSILNPNNYYQFNHQIETNKYSNHEETKKDKEPINTNVIQKKIQIQSNLLFNNKNYGKNISRPIQTSYRKNSNKSEAKFYETSAGFSLAKDRPQSKQESRFKSGSTADAKLKTQTFLPQRPQTSKGTRSTTAACKDRIHDVKQRKASENDEEINFNIKISDKRANRNISSSYAKRNQSNQLSFETSIDPQFLSLFAN